MDARRTAIRVDSGHGAAPLPGNGPFRALSYGTSTAEGAFIIWNIDRRGSQVADVAFFD